MLVLYAMKVMNVAMCTRSMIELCYEMPMELERIFILRNMPCNVSYRTSCIFVCHLHRDTSPLCHKSMNSIFMFVMISCGLFLFCGVQQRVICCARPRSAQGVRIRARLVGLCVRTWTVCREVPHIQPYPERKVPKVM